MSELLRKDLAMKAISVLIAIILWFMVLDQSNPFETKSLKVPLNVLNQEELADRNIILKNLNQIPQFVEINLQGRHNKLNSINETDFVATLDLSKIDKVTTKSLRIDGPAFIKEGKNLNDVTFSAYPQYIDLVLDAEGENVFPINVTTKGKIKENYKITKIEVNPEKYQLAGTDSLLKTVGAINALIDVANLDQDTEFKINCSVSDINKKDITKGFKSISVTAKVFVAKAVPVKTVISGVPAPNYLNVSNLTNPKTVFITGIKDVLAGIDYLETEPISIENMNQNQIITSKLILPEGVKLVEGTEAVTVSLAIEPLAKKNFYLSKAAVKILNKEIDNSLKYEILTESISIEIKGPRYELEKLSLTTLVPSIDVDKLSEGDYKIPLKLSLPETVRPVQEYTVDLSVLKR